MVMDGLAAADFSKISLDFLEFDMIHPRTLYYYRILHQRSSNLANMRNDRGKT